MLRRVLPLVALLLVGAPAFAQSVDLLSRQQAYTILVPLSAMNIDSRSFSGQLIVSAELAGEDLVRMIPNNRTDWRVSGFPAEQEVRFHSLRRDNRRQRVEVEYRNDLVYFKFRFPMGPDANDVLRPFVALGGVNDAGPKMLVAQQMQDLTDFVFRDRLSVVPVDSRPALLELARQAAKGIGVSAVDYRDQTFFTVDIGGDGMIYNTLKLNQSERVSRAVAERALLLLKAFAVPLRDADGLAGVALKMTVDSQNFVNKGAVATETISVYAPASVIAAFANDDTTSQQFIDQCFVIVDANRVSVNLSLQ